MGHEVDDVEEIRDDDAAANPEAPAAVPTTTETELVSADVPTTPPAIAVSSAPTWAPPRL